LKGADRPIQSEQARAEVMGAIECVDLIVIFNEDTPLEVIKLLKPDLLVKGEDYEEKDIIGADFVTRIGGSVLRISLKEGCSTTGLIDRFKH
jgi:D-beta-D-heptose 7-phosphate kinase/D-beta-D-heptose 1-phosphate adenosyltransferase